VLLLASITGSLTDFITTLIGKSRGRGRVRADGAGRHSSDRRRAGDALRRSPGGRRLLAVGRGLRAPRQHEAGGVPDVVAAGIAGDTLGSLCGWAIGIFGGRPLLERHGRWLHLSHERFERAERWFERFGSIAVPLGRITPFARSLVSVPPACSERVLAASPSSPRSHRSSGASPSPRSGFALGTKWRTVERSFRYVDIAVVVLILAAVALIILRRWRAGKWRTEMSKIH